MATKRKGLPRGPRPVVVPVMSACPDCGVELEPGRGKHRLAWHGCRGGPSTLELVEQDILAQMRVAAGEAKVPELIALLDAIRAQRKAVGTGASSGGEVADWLTRRT
jgi:hypothetical protein